MYAPHPAPGQAAPGEHPRLSLAAAAACALEACELLAHLHARGFASGLDLISFTPANLRVFTDGREWHVAWRIPGGESEDLRPITDDDIDALFSDEKDDASLVGCDIRRLFQWFEALCSGAARPAAPEGVAALTALTQFGSREAGVGPFASVASFAGLLVPLVDDPSPWAARVATLPRVRSLPHVRLDWDAVIAEGEGMLAGPASATLLWRGRDLPRDGWVELPLAAAYHQRACRSFARNDLAAALRDVDRAVAIDDFFSYRTTRAIILDGLGRVAEARVALDRRSREPEPPRLIDWDQETMDREDARAHATRGVFALHDGAPDLAAAELRRACELQPIAAYIHAFATALHAAGDRSGAAEADARAVALAPDEPRYRWALAVRLHELGRGDEARTHAEQALLADPERYRDRFARRFG